ncbi:MAG: terminase TerL endonuclease subunit [Rhizobiaceae bacterium]
MKLLPSQREFIESVFAKPKRNQPRVSLAILSQAKGNGKSGLVAGICLAGLLGPLSEERGAVYSASIDRGKAGVIFDEMKAIILRVPEFAVRCNITDFHKKIHVITEGDGFDSTFSALSADASGAQGLAPTLWVYDELGEAKDGELLTVLLESEGKRDHTLGIVLSTQAESDDHPLSRLIDDAETGADQSVHLQIHRAPIDADPFSDQTLKAANPAWGVFLDHDALVKSRNRAMRIPAFEPAYRRLRLNQRIDSRSEDRLVTAAVWKQNVGDTAANDMRVALKGRAAFGGLDLAGKNDLCALVLVFPSDDVPVRYDILPFFWTPQGQMDKRTPAEQQRFREWESKGFLNVVKGDVVTTDIVAREIEALKDEFDLKTVNYDKWRIEYLKKDLADLNITDLPMDSFGQGHSKAMAPAIEFLAECALTSRLGHGGHPVLTASVSQAIVTLDRAGNPMIDKPKSNKSGPVRIDGAVALTMALGAAKGWEPPPRKRTLANMLRRPVMVGI